MARSRKSMVDSNVAFLMTDIEGSTRLWEDDPEAMNRALARHDDLLEQHVATAGGRLLTHRGEGDSAFVAFADPTGAVGCAVSVQRAFVEEPWPTRGPIRVRVGVHVGNALGREADYIQPAINRCARMRDLATGGQILASGDCVRSVTQPPEGTSFRYLGDHVLRGLGSPIAVFQVCHPEIPSEFPDIAPRGAGPTNNLPAETTSFVGRERDLQHLADLLAGPGHRLVTLTGAGGVGKTRLALRAARAAVPLFADGVWLVDLTVLSDARLLKGAVSSALRVPEEAGRRVADTLDDFLTSRKLLIVLDNCEHLVEECATFVAHLLQTAPDVTIMATSREALRVAGEQTVIVDPLELTDPGAAGPAASGDAATLFLDRAGLAGVSLDPSPAVDEICAHLDGLPLAIELAASWAPFLSPGEIAEGLSDRFRLLTGGPRATPRHETLRGSVDWSHALLEEEERVLFRRLAVFAGPFTLEAVQRVCGAADSFATIGGLVRKSLVVVADRSHRPTRYRLLETLRAYALDRLTEAGESEDMNERLAEYIGALCTSAERQLGIADRDWTNRIEDEHANIRSALEWTKDRNAESYLRICAALTVHWANNARYSEGRMWLSAAAAINEAPPELRAKVLWGLGFITALEFNFPEAVAPFQQALEIFRSISDERGIARCQCWMGLILAFAAGKTAARPLIDEGLALARKTDDRFALFTGLYALGLVIGTMENAPAARPVFAEGIEVARSIGDPVGIAALTTFAGMAELFAGEYRRAEAILRESLALAAASRGPLWISAALTFLGGVLDQMGRYEDAKDTLEESSELSGRIGHVQQSRNWHWRSRIALHRGDFEEAESLIQSELAGPVSRQFLYGMLMRVQRTELLCARGDHEAVRETTGKTIERLRENEARWGLARVLLMRSRSEWALKDHEASMEFLRESTEVAGTFGDRATIVDCIEWGAHVAASTDDVARSAVLLGAANRIRSETGYAIYPIDQAGMEALRKRIGLALGVDEMKRMEASGDALSDLDALSVVAGTP